MRARSLQVLKSKLSFSLISDYLSSCKQDEEEQVSRGAKQTLLEFNHDLLVAVSKEAWRQFYCTNGDMGQASKTTRCRLPWGVVGRAIDEVLTNPEKHLPEWVGRISGSGHTTE